MKNVVYSLASLKEILEKEKLSDVCIVTSQTILDKAAWAVQEIGLPNSKVALVPDGEAAKEWDEVKILLDKFIEFKLDRNSIVLALGGGTIGDLVGFAAGIYLRGIKYIQIPTTLLAQIDSAHGGKTGINFFNYKNQIGNFNLPSSIVIDNRFLKSLSKDQIIDGLGEIIKAGLIKDTKISSLLGKENIDTLLQSKELTNIIDRAIKVKQFYIKKDFYDKNIRQVLNVGHTIGHALELKYKISHGKAVIMGMLQELELTEKLQLSSPTVRKNLLILLSHLGIEIDMFLKPDWEAILHDKKIIGDKIMLPVIVKEGKVEMVELDVNILKNIL